jgi:hypothetical protein
MLHRKTIPVTGLGIALLLLAAAPLAGSTVVYDDRALWEAATPGFTNIGFEGLTSTYADYSNAAGLTQSGVQFLGLLPSSYQLYVVNGSYFPEFHDWGSGAILKGPSYFETQPTRELKVLLPANVNSIGVDLMTIASEPGQFTVVLSTGEQWTGIGTLDKPNRRFWGVSTDVPIAEIHFQLTSGINLTSLPGLDNFAFGTLGAGGGVPPDPEAETPEMATIVLVGTGLILLRRLGRRRKLALAI